MYLKWKSSLLNLNLLCYIEIFKGNISIIISIKKNYYLIQIYYAMALKETSIVKNSIPWIFCGLSIIKPGIFVLMKTSLSL